MRRILRWTLVSVLLLIGILLLLTEPIKNALITSYHPKITRHVVQRNQHHAANYNLNQVKVVTANRVIQARLAAKDLRPVGQLVVPSVNLHLPIALGVDNNTLMLAAGTMRPNQQMGRGNYALAGHHMLNSQVLFSPLYRHAAVGTTVYLTDMQTVYQYQIDVRKFIAPTQVSVINDTTQPKITLITCNDSGNMRLLLQGRLIQKMPLKAAPSIVLHELQQTTNNKNVLKGY